MRTPIKPASSRRRPRAAARMGKRSRSFSRGGSLHMDMTWITDRIAVGGGIWTEPKMIEVVRAGVTHVIDMQIEFDDTPLARPYGVEVLWNAVDDDFQPKGPEIFQRGVEFAMQALRSDPQYKIIIYCANTEHVAPLISPEL